MDRRWQPFGDDELIALADALQTDSSETVLMDCAIPLWSELLDEIEARGVEYAYVADMREELAELEEDD